MRIFWVLLLLLVAAASSFPLFDFSLSDPTTDLPVPAIHHRHKHHRHHKHKRRSLSSKEDAKTRGRNKQVMLTKPYWPWP